MGFKNPFKADDNGAASRGEYELVDNGGPSNRKVEGEEEILTEAEKQSLRKVADDLPWSTFLVAIVELCERFTYYGLSGPFQNYISNSYHDPSGLPGALGLNQHGATALTNFFQFWCYLTPIMGAVLADQYLGKYWTIFYFSIVYVVGIAVLFFTSLPASIEGGMALPGLVVAMVVIGLGTGGIKANVSPLIAEQYRNTKAFVRTLKTGEKVLVDPAVTVQRIYMIFYMCINFGSLSSLITTTMELHVGFWAAYGLCLATFIVGFVTLVAGKKKYVLKPPKGSVLPHAARICWIGSKKRNLDAAKPEYMDKAEVPWDSTFVEEVRQALVACKVFLFYPVYWCVYGQMLNNFISQAGQMELHGIPNDIMANIDPITIIIFIPLVDTFLYPLLRRHNLPFPPIARITAGFLLAALAMLYTAYVQVTIYASPPCYSHPRACPAALLPSSNSYTPNKVHIALQSPAYFLMGLSEIFASVTGLELAFTRAPESMKSLVMSVFLLTTAGGAVLGAGVSPFAKDPGVVGLYLGLGAVCAVVGGVFWGSSLSANS
ncbi:hypothetical protein M409DRAFT_70348 [Zasmidium cellare ATCC 36951]|uniref:Peptide transporter PTR2-A n=1 Tax=Zasmidium cellare ATCC 36951 TaxID=1080233 RepID=A0A6A6C4E4_ZASCE|nr:uncharacterized protein M409DRAFT_70348 [Zasmidium cellare ATCC 36951]KAF2160609.1 hypothetical protein M409DRAFT_70348 [Zasmidium cellare ATCC 36951]